MDKESSDNGADLIPRILIGSVLLIPVLPIFWVLSLFAPQAAEGLYAALLGWVIGE